MISQPMGKARLGTWVSRVLASALLPASLLAGATGPSEATSDPVQEPEMLVLPTPQTAIGGAPASAYTAGGMVRSPGTSTYQAVSDNFTQIGGCTFYASNSSAGAWCSTGGYRGKPQSLQAYLNGREFHYCRYFEPPNGFYINAPRRAGGDWMLKGCFRDVDFTEPWGGRDVRIEILSEFVEDGDDTSLPGYMEVFWDVKSDTNFYPVPRISVAPAFPARVGTYTFFHVYWFEALDTTNRVLPRLNINYDTLTEGNAVLRARIEDVVIRPAPGMDEVDCDEASTRFDADADDAIPESEGGDQESDCWAVYEHSSADRDDDTVSLHAKTYWRVTVETDTGIQRDLGRHYFAAGQKLPVAEVQSLVDW